jgi:dTDP-glucose 4,6-dehydratase
MRRLVCRLTSLAALIITDPTNVNALSNKPLPIYGDGLNIRDWLYVEDHCSAIDLVMHNGVNGEVYNVGGSNERTNIQIVETILEHLGKPKSLMTYVQDRLGHDRRYGIDASKITEQLGWSPQYPFETGIKKTIDWYLANRAWWERIQKWGVSGVNCNRETGLEIF